MTDEERSAQKDDEDNDCVWREEVFADLFLWKDPVNVLFESSIADAVHNEDLAAIGTEDEDSS